MNQQHHKSYVIIAYLITSHEILHYVTTFKLRYNWAFVGLSLDAQVRFPSAQVNLFGYRSYHDAYKMGVNPDLTFDPLPPCCSGLLRPTSSTLS